MRSSLLVREAGFGTTHCAEKRQDGRLVRGIRTPKHERPA
jgi:hypothetical protein